MDEYCATAEGKGDMKQEMDEIVPEAEHVPTPSKFNEPGVALIKPEFIDLEHKMRLSKYIPQDIAEQLDIDSQNQNKRKENTNNDGTAEGPPAKQRKIKGRFKKRVREKRLQFQERVCPAVVREEPCGFGDKCRFTHDVKKYLEDNPPLPDDCYVYTTYGKCRFGVTCVHAKQHIGDDYKNLCNEELVKKYDSLPSRVTNVVTRQFVRSLDKRQYDFRLSNNVVKLVKNGEIPNSLEHIAQRPDRCEPQHVKPTNSNTHSLENDKLKVLSTTPIRSLDSEGIQIRSPEKTIDFKDKLYLAPLTTVGNLPYRRLCKEFGADITCSEMATCTGLIQGNYSEWALMKRHHTEDLFGAQVCGAYPDTLTRCTQLLMEQSDVDFIDVNLGCPIDLFYKKGEGCALMAKTSKLETILTSMKAVMSAPLTVKMRTGIFEYKPVAHKLIPRVRDIGVSLVTLHGRSREQRYTRLADWEYINQCCMVAAPLPVFGCGDILSYDDYMERRQHTGVAGCMIARGALIKPWIFTEIKEERNWDISSNERLEILKRFTNYGLEHWGSDVQGVATTRKFLLEWLSFLHRYIPVGILERPPQRINEKPPHYFGRNDLETLMASRNCGDWVKISEMLLGPVSDDFEFLPKHKANAYS